MADLPSNLKIILDTDLDNIVQELQSKPLVIHATNGTYAKPKDILEGTTLGGFQYVHDHISDLSDVFMIAVNSDKSMKIFTDEPVESQMDRALKVSVPLACQHADRDVLVVFYDEETPRELYQKLLDAQNIQTVSLHKWGGYGIGKDAPVIVGAEYFNDIVAFPFYNKDEKPFCYYDTEMGDQTSTVRVVNLYEAEGQHGDVYLRPDNRPKFPMRAL